MNAQDCRLSMHVFGKIRMYDVVLYTAPSQLPSGGFCCALPDHQHSIAYTATEKYRTVHYLLQVQWLTSYLHSHSTGR